jgi:hypothetical protein
MDAVTNEFPTGITYRPRERRIYVQDTRIDASADWDLVAIEKLEQTRDAASVAIFRPAEVRKVWNVISAVWRNNNATRGRLIVGPVFDVYYDMDD